MSEDVVVQRSSHMEILQLVHVMVSAIVDERNEVSVTANAGVVRVKVAREDVGKVIGKQGRTAKAVRLIMAAAAKTAALRYELVIHEYPREVVADGAI